MVYDEIWVSSLTDAELYRELKALGFDIGPVVINTRKVYERKLLRALNNSSPEQLGNPELVGGDASSSVSNVREDRADHSYAGSGDHGLSPQPLSSLVRGGALARPSGVISPPSQPTTTTTNIPTTFLQIQQQQRHSQDSEEYLTIDEANDGEVSGNNDDEDDVVGSGSRGILERTGRIDRSCDVGETVARQSGSSRQSELSRQSVVASRSWTSTVTSYLAPATFKATAAASSSAARTSASDGDNPMRRALDRASMQAEGQSLFSQIDISQFRRPPLHDKPQTESDQQLSLIRRFREFEQQHAEFESRRGYGNYSSDESPDRVGYTGIRGRPMIERPGDAVNSPAAAVEPWFGFPYWYVELFVLTGIMIWLFGVLAYMYLYPRDGLYLFTEMQFEKEMHVIMALINVIVHRQFDDDDR